MLRPKRPARNLAKGVVCMVSRLPGTTLEVDLERKDAADTLLRSLFLTGGLVLSQVSLLTGLEPYTIQNWVKRGFLPPPVKKKYSRRQVCRLFIINMLRDSMQLDRICRLLSHVNGRLDDEGDDIIDDSALYLYIVELIAQPGAETLSPARLRERCSEVIAGYREPYAGARRRIASALEIIFTAYTASCLKQRAELLLAHLDE